jgi:tetratricopeptide (TPR) repeat protein
MALAVILSQLGYIYVRVGDYELAEVSLKRSRSLYQSVNEPPPRVAGTEPLTGLAMLACIRGNFGEAIRLGEEACRVSQERDDPGNLGLGQYAIISTYFHQGKYQAAQELAEDWLMVLRELGGTWMMAHPLNVLGSIYRILGDYAQAREYYQESYEIMQSFDDPQGMAAALNFLGMTSSLEGDYDKAASYHQESYELYREVGDRGGVGYALCGLGTTALAIGDYKEAGRHFYHSLEIVSAIQYVPVIFHALQGMAELLIAAGQQTRGLNILSLVSHHEQCDYETRNRVKNILDTVSNDLSKRAYKAAVEQGKALVLDNVVQTLLAEFS